MTAYVHPTAIVEDGVRIGAGARVWHHVHLRRGASIGEGTNLGKNVYVDEGVSIGDRVKVQNNVSIYSGVHLADDVFVGPSAVFTNDRVPRASGAWTLSTIEVRQGASIGANATVVAGIEIGAWAMVGAGAVVVRSVSPHEIVAGNPARRLGWLCRCGQVRVRVGEAERLKCGKCETDLRLDG